MTEEKKNLADIARKKRHLSLIEKLQSGKSLTKSEINELDEFENEKEKRVKMSALAVSDYVMVKGSFDGEGGMKAIKIEKREPGGDVVEGTVDKMDIASKTLYIGDITVKMTGDTLVKEPFSLKLTLEQLMLPYYVTCEGKWTGQKEFTADKVVMD